MKRLLCVLLALVLLVGVLPMGALASEGTGNTLYFHGMYRMDERWHVDQESPLRPVDANSFGVPGMNYVIAPYDQNGNRLSGGQLVSSDSKVLQVNPINDTFDLVPAFELWPVDEGTVTVSYVADEGGEVLASSTFDVAMPEAGFFFDQQFSGGMMILTPLFLNMDDDGLFPYWFMTKNGLTKEQADNASVQCNQQLNGKLMMEPVLRNGSDELYDLMVTIDANGLLRDVNYNLTLTAGDCSASLSWSSNEFGLVELGLYAPDGMELQDDFCLADYETLLFSAMNGLTQTELDTLTVEVCDWDETPLDYASAAVEGKVRQDGTYDAVITVDTDDLNPRRNYILRVGYTADTGEQKSLARFFGLVPGHQSMKVNGWTFAFSDEYFETARPYDERMSAPVSNVVPNEAGETYTQFAEVTILPWDRINGDYYILSEEELAGVSVTVHSLELIPCVNFGDETALSLAEGTTQVTTLTQDLSPTVKLYAKSGCQGAGVLVADVTIEAGGSKDRGVIRLGYRQTIDYNYTISDGTADTAALNAKLQELAAIPVNGSTVHYTVELEDNTNYGTIVIPEGFYDQGRRLYLQGGENTSAQAIDLNGAYLYGLSGVDFKAGANTQKAIYNGCCLLVEDCSFVGYHVAMDSTDKGLITAYADNLFIDNGIAIRVDVENFMENVNTAPISRNTFIDNGIAVQVLSVMDGNLTPYYFRVTDNNMIDNDVDFDVQEEGTFYFYRNYYGKWKNGRKVGLLPHAVLVSNYNNILKSRTPVVQGEDGNTRVITNSRWNYPVKDLLKYHTDIETLLAARQLSETTQEQEYENFLTADWERETILLNEEAVKGSLSLGEEALETLMEAETLTVVDEFEQTMGVWTLNPAEAGEGGVSNTAARSMIWARRLNDGPALDAADFHPQLEVQRNEDGSVVVTVAHSDLLPVYQPTLSIAGDSSWMAVSVTYLEEPLQDVTVQNGVVTFPVTAGGTYVIDPISTAELLCIFAEYDDKHDCFLAEGSFGSLPERMFVGNGCLMTFGVADSMKENMILVEDLTSDDPSVLKVTKAGKTDADDVVFMLEAVGVGTANLCYTGGGSTICAPITVQADGAGKIGMGGMVHVGFGSRFDDGSVIICDQTAGQFYGGSVVRAEDPANAYVPFQELLILAAAMTPNGYQELGLDIQLDRMWIQSTSGDAAVFSFRPDALVTELGYEDLMAGVTLYRKDGHVGAANLLVQGMATLNGEDCWFTAMAPVAVTEQAAEDPVATAISGGEVCTYATLAEAIAAADEGETVSLLQGVVTPITVSRAITILRNGCTAVVYAGEGYEVTTTDEAYVVTAVSEEKFGLYGANVVLGNDLNMEFAFAQNLADDWSGHYVEIIKEYADGTPDRVDVYEFDAGEWTVNGAYYVVSFDGIAAKEMCDTLYVTVYNGQDEPVSAVWEDSMRAYAMRIYDKADTDLARTAIVDMLNYGAAAQLAFGYGTDDLANADLTAEQLAFASGAVEITNGNTEKGELFYGSNLVIRSNIEFQLAYSGLDPSMYAEVTFTNHKNESVEATIPGSAFVRNGGYYVLHLDQLVVADARKTITVTIYDGEGNVVTTTQESVEEYLARRIEKGLATEVEQAFMRFADSAHAYLHRNDEA